MSHRPRTRLRCRHDYRGEHPRIDPQARKLTRYDVCRACGHKRRFAPPSADNASDAETQATGGDVA